MSKYDDILGKTIDQLDRPDRAAREQIYDRARQALSRHLAGADPPWPQADVHAQFRELEAAITRLEGRYEGGPAAPSPSRPGARPPARRWPLFAAGAAVLALLLGAGAYMLLPQGEAPQPPPAQQARAPSPAPAPRSITPAPTDVSASPSYVLRRQRVYYRTTHPVGTIVISRSQRFLYLVQPNQSAVRYAIGVGPECEGVAGLFRISEKVERPQAADLSGPNQSLPADDGFGPRALLFGPKRSVHGTSEPDRIGRNATFGCFHSWNDDIVELYGRVVLNERVVVMN